MLHDAGLDHRAIHGWEADTVSVSRRYDLAAHTRRVAAFAGRRALSVAFGGNAVVAGVTGAATGTLWLTFVAILLGAVAAVVYSAPEWCFEAPDPAFERGSLVVEGMTDKEVMRRFAIARERDAYVAERKEEAAKRERRKAKARQNL